MDRSIGSSGISMALPFALAVRQGHATTGSGDAASGDRALGRSQGCFGTKL
jgi:hypothetical protein